MQLTRRRRANLRTVRSAQHSHFGWMIIKMSRVLTTLVCQTVYHQTDKHATTQAIFPFALPVTGTHHFMSPRNADYVCHAHYASTQALFGCNLSAACARAWRVQQNLNCKMWHSARVEAITGRNMLSERTHIRLCVLHIAVDPSLGFDARRGGGREWRC